MLVQQRISLVIARYNLERFSNNLARSVHLNIFRDPIAEGYFPKMDSFVPSRACPPCAQNKRISDLNRTANQLKVHIGDLESWRDRIIEAIQQGFATSVSSNTCDYGDRVELSGNSGTDTLGNMLESSIISPNRAVYGDFHNVGHFFISYAHDSDHRYLEAFGVMGDSTTAMRDPVFYRWRAYIDGIFQEHKNRLPVYTMPQLQYDGISVTGLQHC
uniref:Hemocyanin_M domain-containing protein n=1 Tax=Glossina brevipalpis TaxID=37001 RepID=A0A1A9X4Y5_9MUSC